MPCFSSHICLPASVVVLQPTILSCAALFKTQLLCLDLGSALDSIICQCREWRIALCCLLLMPYPALLLPPSPAFSLPLSHCVLLSLSYHLFSLPGLGSFYCLKGTLLTTHICPFIILRGLFYSCPGTVADADRCLATLNRSQKASAGQHMHGGGERGSPLPGL